MATIGQGSPSPLGVTRLEQASAYNFALYARHATAVTLLLYVADDIVHPVVAYDLEYLSHKSGPIWHCQVDFADSANAAYYAYRISGPNTPGSGNRYDPQKILLDPYAPGLFFPPTFNRKAAQNPGPNDGLAPLGVLPGQPSSFDWGDDHHPRHTSDTIIYEMHVRGFTQRANSGVSEANRGTFAGIVEKIPYLLGLGVTAVELMPVFQFDPQENNYWGYMPMSFFMPQAMYSRETDIDQLKDEFRTMVKQLHAAGIEVILDVVYNHTAEKGADGPTYSYRGIDNSTYYLLQADQETYNDDAGTGNVLRCAQGYVRKLIMDSLRFWVKEMHVDGFRFDLASILTRTNDGSLDTHDPAVIADISSDPDFANIRLIAEAWDITAYELGRSFPGAQWAQWNGKFRDDVRRFIKSDDGMVAALMTRVYGSADLFPDDVYNACKPAQSINYITSHDGFCLYDLVAYNTKHNEANGFANSDGTNDNFSWNCGTEGDVAASPEIIALRQRQIKNFCCVLLVSNGTPMIVSGSEFMQTQRGNNNPYNQDNTTTWLDWDLQDSHKDIYRFFKSMIAFRKAHPSLSRSQFWRDDVRWYGVGSEPDLGESSHTLAYCVHGASVGDTDIYVMLNAYWDDLPFIIQEGGPGQWRLVADTALSSPDDCPDPSSPVIVSDMVYTVKARSVVVLCRQ